MPTEKKRIAILGGGPGGIAAAFALTRNAADREKLEVTVYQPGWRLGGKCASGFGKRIEEHGLHVWAGFYDHAFGQLKECYRELGLDWTRVFTPVHDFGLGEQRRGQLESWPVHLPGNAGEPGTGGDRTLWDLLMRLIDLMTDGIVGDDPVRDTVIDRLDDVRRAAQTLGVEDHIPAHAGGPLALNQRWWSHGTIAVTIRDRVQRTSVRIAAVRSSIAGGTTTVRGATIARCFMQGVIELAAAGGDDAPKVRAVEVLAEALEEARQKAQQAAGNVSEVVRRSRIGWETAKTILRGIFADRLLARGTDSIDDIELREWFQRHGAQQDIYDSSIIRAGYDWAFAFDGNTHSIGAGVALEGFLRLSLDYRGAAFFKSAGSLGDVVYVPMYEALKRRGVRFRFFHRVEEIELDAGQRRVTRIVFAEQAKTVDGSEYQPLVAHPAEPGARVWPRRPNFADLEQGASLVQLLEMGEVDLESGASTDGWEGCRTVALVDRSEAKPGDDVFDYAVLAFPPACQEIACKRFLAKPEWRDMLAHVKSTRTVAMQLWFEPTLQQMGYQGDAQMTTACPWPYSTWADMKHVMAVEPAPAKGGPVGSLVYLCGNAPLEMPPDPAGALEWAKTKAIEWLKTSGRAMWPGFDFRHLHDPQNRADVARLEAQYIRVNVRPADLYVLSVPGSLRYRLRADGSGIDNLYLAGDWVRTDLSAGCVEAAVSSGEDVANALLPVVRNAQA